MEDSKDKKVDVSKFAEEVVKPLEPQFIIDGKTIEHCLQEAEIDPSETPSRPPTAISVGSDSDTESFVATFGNVSLVIGKAKSRKTFFITVTLAAASGKPSVLNKLHGHLPSGKQTVLLFDTEQGNYHLHKTVSRVLQLIGQKEPANFRAFGLRKYKPAERLKLIKEAIYREPQLGFVVIDGIRDLVTGINNEEEATEITSHLMKWSEELQIHIMTVLHQNKGDRNARGHLGTEMVNKAETTISIVKDDDQDISIVKADYSRALDFEPFAFRINDDGLPEIVENWLDSSNESKGKPKVTPSSFEYPYHKYILTKVFAQIEKPRYTEFWMRVKTILDTKGIAIGDNKAKDFLEYYLQNEYVIQHGKKGGRGSYYSPAKLIQEQLSKNDNEDGFDDDLLEEDVFDDDLPF